MNPNEEYNPEDRWEYEQHVEEMERAYDEAIEELLIEEAELKTTGLKNVIEIGGE